MFRFKIFQMRLQHPEEKIDIVGRLWDFENAFVTLLVRKRDPQPDFSGDEINRAQPHCKLLQKAAEHEKQRLGSFDLVLKFEALIERFRGLNKFEQPIRYPICPFPKADRFRAKPCCDLFFIEGSKLSKCLNSPLVQDLQDLPNLSLSIFSSRRI